MEERKNNVISRKYVETHYIKKKDLINFIEKELNMIKNGRDVLKNFANDDVIDGIRAGYLAILHLVKNGKEENKE